MSIHADWPFVTIHWQPSLAAVHTHWHAATTSRGYRLAMETALRLLERQAALRWVDDCRDLAELSGADRQWYTEVWYPRVKALGLEFLAIVPSADEVQAPWVNPRGGAVRDVRVSTTGSPCVAFFERPTEAIAWLAGTVRSSGIRELGPSNEVIPERSWGVR